MIVLDTQPVSQLQRSGSRDIGRLEEKLRSYPFEEVRITVITPLEQLRECLAKINSTTDPLKQVPRFELLLILLDHYSRSWTGRILPFDEHAAVEFRKFSPQLIRAIGRGDAQVAAIALAHDATVLTANVRDFRLVPGLKVEEFA